MAGALQIRNNESESRFECDVDGKLSVVEYQMAPDKIIFTHTEVPSELSGRGIAQKMVTAALDHALCSYVASYIERQPQYRELVSD